MKRGIIKYLSCLLLFSHLLLQAAPTSLNGNIIELKQVDNSKFSALVFGDEFYRRFEYNDYSIIQNSDGNWCYAILKNGEYSPSSFIVGKDSPQNIVPNLIESKEVISAKFKNKYDVMRVKSGFEKEYLDFKKLRADFLQKSELQTRSPQPVSIPENVLGLCILVDFSDDVANKDITQAKIEDIMNKENYSDSINKGSVYDYYIHQSSGKLKLKQLVTAYVRVPKTKAEYDKDKDGSNSQKIAWIFVRDVISALKVQQPNLDYSKLTLNGKSPISLSIFYAGKDAPGYLWPHSWAISELSPKLTDDIIITNYQMTAIGDSVPTIGVFCHESGHMVCRFWDYYDYGSALRYDCGDNIKSAGIGSHCLMGAGNDNGEGGAPAPISAYLKNIMNWGKCYDLKDFKTYEISALENSYFKYKNPTNPLEYFLLENRKKGILTNPYQNALPAEGLTIWHIDESVKTMNELQQMTFAQHYECSLEQADGFFNLENRGNYGDASDYFGTNQKRNFNSSTIPNSNWWDGSNSGLNIANISAPAEKISFELYMNESPFLGLDASHIYALSSSAKKTIKVLNYGKESLNWTAVSDSSWLQLSSSKGTISTTDFTELELNLEENATSDLRSGTITFSSDSPNVINSPQVLKIIQQENFSTALDNFNLELTNLSDISWKVVDDSTAIGEKSLKSGKIGDDNATSFSTEIKGQGFLSFNYKISSEEEFDFFNLYNNNNLIYRDSGISPNWINLSAFFFKGNYSLKFEYKKDNEGFRGDDAVWLDNLEYKEFKIIISGVYTGGGNSDSSYKNDYIELFNDTDSEIDLTNYTLIFAESVATNVSEKNTFKFPKNAKIKAKRFALIKCASGNKGSDWTEGIFDFDASGIDGKNMELSTESGKILLFNSDKDLSAENSIPKLLTKVMFLPHFENYLPYGKAARPAYDEDITMVDLSDNTAMKCKYDLATKVMDFSADLTEDYEVVVVNQKTPRNSKFINTKIATPENVEQVFLEAESSQVDCIVLSSGDYSKSLVFNPQKETLLLGEKGVIIHDLSVGKKCVISRCVIKNIEVSENVNLYRCTLINIDLKNSEKIKAYSTIFWKCSGIENLAIKENCASDSFSHEKNTIDNLGNLKLDPNDSTIDPTNYNLKSGSLLINRGKMKDFQP